MFVFAYMGCKILELFKVSASLLLPCVSQLKNYGIFPSKWLWRKQIFFLYWNVCLRVNFDVLPPRICDLFYFLLTKLQVFSHCVTPAGIFFFFLITDIHPCVIAPSLANINFHIVIFEHFLLWHIYTNPKLLWCLLPTQTFKHSN